MNSRSLLFFCAALATAPFALATQSFSFTGTFTSDTDVQFITFTLNADTPGVTLQTWSYGGGTNAAGTPIPAGGFDLILSLFDATGQQLNSGFTGDASCTAPQVADPATGICGDVFYPTTRSFPGGIWTAGTYTLAITENPNSALGFLSDGFFDEGVLGFGPGTNFTCQPGPTGFQGNPPTFPVTDPFCSELSLTERTGNWAVDILNVDNAQLQSGTPEPATAILGGAGLALLAMARRFRKR